MLPLHFTLRNKVRPFWKIQVPKTIRIWSVVWRMRLQYFANSPSLSNFPNKLARAVFTDVNICFPSSEKYKPRPYLMTSFRTFSLDTIYFWYNWIRTQTSCENQKVRMAFGALLCACVMVLCSAAPFKLPQRIEPENDRPIIGKPLVFILYIEQVNGVVH